MTSSKLPTAHGQETASASPQPGGSASFLGDWRSNQPCSGVISEEASDVVSGCPWPESHHSRLPSDGVSCPLPRSLTICSQVCHIWALLSCLTCLSGPDCWTVVPATQISGSYGHETIIWEKLWDTGRSLYREETFRSYRFSPGLYFFALTMPVSTTYFIPVMVMEVSAMLVEMITLRQP